MPTTTNFGWTTPADTDLVKDGAAAIRTLGNGVDTSLVDLKGGTTGQVLSKASNTDLDYSWVTPNVGDITEVQAGTGISVASGTGPIPVVTNSMATEITAKGDLIVGTGSGTFDNLAVGTNGYTLVADSAETTGLKWQAASSGGLTLIATADLSGATAIQFTSIPTTYTHLQCVFINCYSSSSYWNVRFNNDSGNNYNSQASSGSTISGNSGVAFAGAGDQNTNLGIIPVTFNGTNNGTANGSMTIYNYASTTLQRAGEWQTSGYDGNSYRCVTGTFNYNSTGTAITQIDFIRGSTQTITGKIQLWGVK